MDEVTDGARDPSSFAGSHTSTRRTTFAEGNYHGVFQRPDEDMLAIWQVAVQETRDELEHGWH